MFNFGWGEIVLIGIVALIAIGPKELPTVLRSVGQMVAKLRRMANEFQGQFQEALREAEIADLKKTADEITSAVKSQVTDFTKIDPLADARRDVEKAFEEPAGSPTSTASVTVMLGKTMLSSSGTKSAFTASPFVIALLDIVATTFVVRLTFPPPVRRGRSELRDSRTWRWSRNEGSPRRRGLS